ncbi:MAG: SCP2 sterol-binding domain-containing protein [Gammaproteobacteria bacterium]|nr:SCP2 sterol-binding domain-containing protein [Gammaproteobacteria bacterium]MDH5592968.1 SCP2 sterol-binding domain-containing protein [Gammaproteobacteria bacterium]MDH5613611.1 SCP2 sterol-binding domain-containing protein [Gammaproteobacteria bacterium]
MNPVPLFPLPYVLRYVPDFFHGRFIAQVFNHVMRGQGVKADLDYLNGKIIRLVVTDTDNEFCFYIHHNKLRVAKNEKQPDVTISGKLQEFYALAVRNEDPDTLFFSRRLSMEGDTDAGLYLKNILDGLEYDLESHICDVLGIVMGSRVYNMIIRTHADQFLRSALGKIRP